MKQHIHMIFVALFFLSRFVQAATDTQTHWQPNNSHLFTSPSERAKLDSMRQAASAIALQAQETQKEPEVESTSTPLLAEIIMQGYVKRSDGKKSTVWINHQALQEKTVTNDVQVGNLINKNTRDSHTISIKLPSNGQKFNLKAGQSYLPDENRVSEVGTSTLKARDEK